MRTVLRVEYFPLFLVGQPPQQRDENPLHEARELFSIVLMHVKCLLSILVLPGPTACWSMHFPPYSRLKNMRSCLPGSNAPFTCEVKRTLSACTRSCRAASCTIVCTALVTSSFEPGCGSRSLPSVEPRENRALYSADSLASGMCLSVDGHLSGPPLPWQLRHLPRRVSDSSSKGNDMSVCGALEARAAA